LGPKLVSNLLTEIVPSCRAIPHAKIVCMTIVNGYTIKPGADLREANLEGAFLRGLDLHGADLSEANLTNANLSETNLSGAKLTDAVLCGATLHEANLEGANLDGADLSIWQYWDEDHNEIEQGTDLEKANFRSASLINSDFYGAYVVDADFTGANITDANFAYAELRNCDFTDTIGEGTGYFAEEDDRLKKYFDELESSREYDPPD